jgi:hypothetical protein
MHPGRPAWAESEVNWLVVVALSQGHDQNEQHVDDMGSVEGSTALNCRPVSLALHCMLPAQLSTLAVANWQQCRAPRSPPMAQRFAA